jgi:hypothetical protein
MAAEASEKKAAGGIGLSALLEIVAAGAAITGWVAVVGGAHMFARLEAAHFSPSPSVAFQPRQALLVEGLRTLLFPLLAAAFIASIGWYTWNPPAPDAPPEEDFESAFREWLHTDEGRLETALWWSEREPGTGGNPLPELRSIYARRILDPSRTAPGDDVKAIRFRNVRRMGDFLLQSREFLVVAVITLLSAAIYIFAKYDGWSILWALCVAVAAVTAGFFAVPRSQTQRGRALALFAIVLLSVGAANILLASGKKHPTFDLALVVRKKHTALAGFFVAKNDGDVFIAQKLEGDGRKFRVVMIPKDDIQSFSYGPAREVFATDTFTSENLKRTVFSGRGD